jgi:hypothetical protein
MPIIIREKIPIICNYFLLLLGIYIEIGIDWNRFPAGKRIDYDKVGRCPFLDCWFDDESLPWG